MRFAVLVLLAPALSAQANDAEKLFRAMEKKITAADSVRVVADITLHEGGKDGKVKSTLALAQGNKINHVTRMLGDGLDFSLGVVADGTNIRYTPDTGAVKPGPVPKRLHERASAMLSRAGFFGGSWLFVRGGGKAKDKDLKIEVIYRVHGFKMGRAEKLNGRNAKVLHYHLDVEGKDQSSITLWLDAKTLIPMKRVILPDKKGAVHRITEAYTEFQLNPKLDARTFELPR